MKQLLSTEHIGLPAVFSKLAAALLSALPLWHRLGSAVGQRQCKRSQTLPEGFYSKRRPERFQHHLPVHSNLAEVSLFLGASNKELTIYSYADVRHYRGRGY